MYCRQLIIALCLFTAVPTLQAETRTDYAVDIIVFEDSEAPQTSNEQWFVSDSSDNAASGQSGRLNRALRAKIRDINPGSYELLNNEAKRLANSKRYRVLARKTWLQPGLDKDNAVDIELGSATAQSGTAGQLSGSVKIVLERYLHLYTDLVYHRANPGITTSSYSGSALIGGSQTDNNNIAIKEHRRMRSKELHYIDHPLVGILIKIVPVETNISAGR